MNNGVYGGDGHEYGPNGLDPYNQSKEKIISTEGCFSCKVNGIGSRGKRSIESDGNSTAILDNSIEQLNTSQPLSMRLKLDQTKHRTNIIQLQPALRNLKVVNSIHFCDVDVDFLNFLSKENIEYEIVKGNEGKQFEIINKRGVWSLHFRRRLKEVAQFKLEIRALKDVDDDEEETVDVDESLDFHVHIQVVP